MLSAINSTAQQDKKKPNIILIMGDDIGFSDIGCYGGEIKTPNIDRLAKQGLKFTTFYNMSKCNPTRSSLLTGMYRGGKGTVHIGNITKSAGYFNIMTGKEHFDPWVPEACKAENVFDRSFTYTKINEFFLPPSGKFMSPFILNGEEILAKEIQHEKSPMYKTDFITDYALKWLDEASQKENPFFLYLPYHAAHFPLQARPKDIAKYRGKYMQGWDKLRKKRFDKMQKLGVIPKNTKMSPAEGNLNKFRKPFTKTYTDYYPWEPLSDAKKDSLDLEMSVFAAMIDRMDQNIGRVLKKLEKNGELDNTLIIFLVDNGSCPYESNRIKDVQPGPANSYWSLRATWANLSNTPYRQYKQFGYEGGCNTPFIASWPGVIKPNTITNQPGHVVDILPTIMDIGNVKFPSSIRGIPTRAPHGKSLLPIFKGEQREEPKFFMSGMDKFRMYRSGDFKIVRKNGGEWELYNIKKDPTEITDLAPVMAAKCQQLANDYEQSIKKINKGIPL